MIKFHTILFLFFSLLYGYIPAQIKVNQTHYHFGTLNADSPRFADFTFKNTGSKKEYILRVNADRDIVWIYNQKTMMPDSSITLRVQYNPKNTGRFNKEIEVYVSSSQQPIILTISGEIKNMPMETSLACPDFSKVSRVQKTPDVPFRILVSDKLTAEPIAGAKIKIIRNGLPVEFLYTGKYGNAGKILFQGYYYMVISAKGYDTYEQELIVNNTTCAGELKIELMPILKNDPVLVLNKPKEKDSIKLQDIVLQKSEDTVITYLPVKTDTTHTTAEHTPNNIVFLVDASSSMQQEGRMELLKTAMIELSEMLREEDKITIVAYAGTAWLALPTTSGNQKETVKQKISAIQGSGYTNGADGMKMAYEQARKAYIEGGRNTVIMATDGAFNLFTTDVIPMVKYHLKKGINTSVIAIKATDTDMQTMKKVAETGRGTFIELNKFEESEQNLLNRIKTYN